jgi:hypothetical protein
MTLLLAEAGDVDGLRARADAGDEEAAWKMARLLAEAGDVDELNARADAGDGSTASRLAGLLAEARGRGRAGRLRCRRSLGSR